MVRFCRKSCKPDTVCRVPDDASRSLIATSRGTVRLGDVPYQYSYDEKRPRAAGLAMVRA